MTDGVDDSALEAIPPLGDTPPPEATPPLGTTPPQVPSMGAPASGPPPGWYPDPWDGGQHRFWNGHDWTADAFPNGPATAWAPLRTPPTPVPDATETFPETVPVRSGRAVVAIAVVGGLLLGFLGAVGVHFAFERHTSVNASAPIITVPPRQPAITLPQQPGTSIPASPPTSTLPGDPSASALSGLVITQADVASTVTVQTLPAGQPTLDVCNGTFPSESLRTARLQVAAIDAQGTESVSTEAVLYANSAATAQAFAELKSAAANCPSAPVVSPVGEPTVSTHFNAAPDSAWPQTPGVDRQAYDFVATDELGQAQHFVGVYLRRGRVLLGVYFAHPDGTQLAISGQTTVAGIVNVFEARMAQLPASVVNGG